MAYKVPRVQIVPQPDDQVSFQVKGQERLRWHSSPRYPRPFFYPLIGPAGLSVTRMGHPAAPDHDHHRSLWWGHQNVGGVNFWEERGGAQQIRQVGWVHYQDGDTEAGIVVTLGWFDAHKARLMRQEMIAVYRPLDPPAFQEGEGWLEIQTTFTPEVEGLKLGKTNFGFLGLRVAASISAHYGGGSLSSEKGKGEKDNFGKQAPWMDYDGPLSPDNQGNGVCWFDHKSNPNHPTSWHVRDDGWMSAAFNLRDEYTLKKEAPLRLRYGLFIHGSGKKDERIPRAQGEFADSAAWEVVKAERPWRVKLQRTKKD